MHTARAWQYQVDAVSRLTFSPDLFSKMRFSSVVLPEPKNPDSRVTGRRVSCISLKASISFAFEPPFDFDLVLFFGFDSGLLLPSEGESRFACFVALVAVALGD
jgi:hypothetical protein